MSFDNQDRQSMLGQMERNARPMNARTDDDRIPGSSHRVSQRLTVVRERIVS
jgi:hypothetical protein